MYEAKNHKELKKLLEQGKTPILVRDRDTITVIKTMESLKEKGVLGTAKEKIIGSLLPMKTGVISEPAMIVLAIISISGLIALYAIYKGQKIKIKYNPDGSITLETYN